MKRRGQKEAFANKLVAIKLILLLKSKEMRPNESLSRSISLCEFISFNVLR